MAGMLGWKDILRPIRDGYRHFFPTPDSGPTPEERSKRREQDRRRGFTYFDTFAQLEAWDIHESDPLQRANTPLLPRSSSIIVDEKHGANILVCHDMSGNYHEYESTQEIGVTDETYVCEYNQYVDTFVYFSHKLVCVPPPSWTNTLHRNGVKALGSFILEPQAKNARRLLQYTEDGDQMKFDLARKLASIAKHYGFDGWLVNIEKAFPKENWHANILEAFLRQLGEELGKGRQLVWYDALTTSNEVSYQNSLNASNLLFAEACGSVLTNYCWNAEQADQSKIVATQAGLDSDKVFFGIDVWAQNRSGFGIPRTTYGKGGTTTGMAVSKLADITLAAGVFAPAWSFEHFPGHGRNIERTVWEGEALPNDLECSCGNATSRHQPIEGFSIIAHARVFPAGSDSFFYTDFTRAFGRHSEEEKQRVFESHGLHAQVGAQSILPLPHPLKDRDKHPHLRYRLEDSPGQAKLVIEAHNGPIDGEFLADRRLPLYKLDMHADETLRIEVACRTVQSIAGALTTLYLKYSSMDDPNSDEIQYISIEDSGCVCTVTALVGGPNIAERGLRLKEIGFCLGGSSSAGIVLVLEVFSISIVPTLLHQSPVHPAVRDVRVKRCGEEDNEHVRLCWAYQGDDGPRDTRLPYSAITGPVSYFLIKVDDLRVGRAYALEYVLNDLLVKELEGKEVKVEITGIAFDGNVLSSNITKLRMGQK
ncbi:hypothetical protein EK21DRAFT_58633 [Setomelanomma holmii]|uniref:Cytosolic endo-beta-N-acetylglucosaminidase TIM barrel domain-containing protein n=1 Tax=Setomelanomma holmii TaxID=210430 RepID=A0A9P4HEQ6_9PLEO|nr:hypothetical protein EK21DRAFT_58633 [Setomelanomma holmii]